jgi:hypothetical protein
MGKHVPMASLRRLLGMGCILSLMELVVTHASREFIAQKGNFT